MTAEVLVSELLGSETMLYVKLGQTEFASRVDARDFHSPGEQVSLTFNVAKVISLTLIQNKLFVK